MYSLTIELFGGVVTIEHESFEVIEILQEFIETQEEGDWEVEYFFELDFDDEEDEDEDEYLTFVVDEE